MNSSTALHWYGWSLSWAAFRRATTSSLWRLAADVNGGAKGVPAGASWSKSSWSTSSSSRLLGRGGLDIIARSSHSATASGERPELESPLSIGWRASDMRSRRKKITKVGLESQQCGTKERWETNIAGFCVWSRGCLTQNQQEIRRLAQHSVFLCYQILSKMLKGRKDFPYLRKARSKCSDYIRTRCQGPPSQAASLIYYKIQPASHLWSFLTCSKSLPSAMKYLGCWWRGTTLHSYTVKLKSQ